MKTIKEVTKGKPVFNRWVILRIVKAYAEGDDLLWLWEEYNKNEVS